MSLPIPRRPRALVLLAGLLPGLAACGSEVDGGGGGGGPGEPDPVAIAPYTEGTRLRPVLLDAGDGATTFLSFFDQELGLRCWFQPTVDGDVRCLPRSGDAWYGDASCATPTVPAGCFGPEAATLEVGLNVEECDDVVAAAVFVPTASEPFEGERSIGFDGRCIPQGGVESMVTAEELPLDRFVRGEVEEVDLAGGLGARRIVADDGATVVTHLLRLGHPCAPAELDGGLRCLDTATSRLDDEAPLFASADCTGAEVAHFFDTCRFERPGMATRGGDPRCGAAMFALGDDVERAYRGGEVCEEYPLEAAFREVLGVIEPADLPAMTVAERGSGRVVVREPQLAGVTAPGGDEPMTRLFDAELGVECQPLVDSAGVVRCFPRGDSLAWYAFADSACTERLFVEGTGNPFEDPSCPSIPDSPFVAVGDGAPCKHTLGNARRTGVVTAVLERGAPYSGPVYTWNDSAGCSGGTPAPGYFFSVGAVHPVEDFPVLEPR